MRWWGVNSAGYVQTDPVDLHAIVACTNRAGYYGLASADPL
jgi:hypothetical protein